MTNEQIIQYCEDCVKRHHCPAHEPTVDFHSAKRCIEMQPGFPINEIVTNFNKPVNL